MIGLRENYSNCHENFQLMTGLQKKETVVKSVAIGVAFGCLSALAVVATVGLAAVVCASGVGILVALVAAALALAYFTNNKNAGSEERAAQAKKGMEESRDIVKRSINPGLNLETPESESNLY